METSEALTGIMVVGIAIAIILAIWGVIVLARRDKREKLDAIGGSDPSLMGFRRDRMRFEQEAYSSALAAAEVRGAASALGQVVRNMGRENSAAERVVRLELQRDGLANERAGVGGSVDGPPPMPVA